MNETILRAFRKGNPPKGKGSHWNYCLYLEASSSSFPSFLFDKSSVRTQILKHWLGWVMVPHIICFLVSPSFSKWEKVLISQFSFICLVSFHFYPWTTGIDSQTTTLPKGFLQGISFNDVDFKPFRVLLILLAMEDQNPKNVKLSSQLSSPGALTIMIQSIGILPHTVGIPVVSTLQNVHEEFDHIFWKLQYTISI